MAIYANGYNVIYIRIYTRLEKLYRAFDRAQRRRQRYDNRRVCERYGESIL